MIWTPWDSGFPRDVHCSVLVSQGSIVFLQCYLLDVTFFSCPPKIVTRLSSRICTKQFVGWVPISGRGGYFSAFWHLPWFVFIVSIRLFTGWLHKYVIYIIFYLSVSDGSSISREIKSERSPREKSSDNDIKPQKKTQFQKKYKQPSIPIDRKKSPKNKLKISDLRPCISKAFCEVNSITEEPTYETSQEFYMILNRLKKWVIF